jgi:putative transposase
VTKAENERRQRAEQARAIGLWRYQVIQDLIDPALTAKQRGSLSQATAERVHVGLSGEGVRISRKTIDRWVRWYRIGGFDALVPRPASAPPRTAPEVLALAESLKRENPARTAAQVRRILQMTAGSSPSDRTLQRLFARLELAAAPAAAQVFGRFEAARPNEIWLGDAVHGPVVAGRRAICFAFLDDHSRAVMGARWGYREDVVRMAAALRPALQSRGIPTAVYVDNGAAYIDAWLLRACACLGIKLIHSTPHRPQGKGKIERFWRSVRAQFLVEIDADAVIGAGAQGHAGTRVADLAELNKLFTAWVETCYHQQVHSETGAKPLARWQQGIPAPLVVPSAAQLAEAFLWTERRKVSKVGTVSLHNNAYEVDPSLAGRYVELAFDPFDLSRIEVRHNGRPAGDAAPFIIRRHSHPKARPDIPGSGDLEPPAPLTGVDYLNLIGQAHHADGHQPINYSALLHPDEDTREETV